MPKLAHSTLESSADENGNSHRFYIEPFVYKCGSHTCVHTAKCFSYASNKYADERHEQIRLAKFPAKSSGKKEWVLNQINISEVVRKSVQLFLKANPDLQLNFIMPQYATLVSVSFLNRSRQKGEFGLFEDKLVDYTQFVDSNGKTSSANCAKRSLKRQSSKCKTSPTNTSTAYSDAFPAIELDNPLIPSCPPYEEDPPPSYEESCRNSFNGNYVFPADRNYLCHFQMHPAVNNLNNLPCFPFTDFDYYSRDVGCPETIQVAYHSPEVRPAAIQVISVTRDDEDDWSHPALRAFIHYDFCQAKGQRVICNLKGTRDNRGSYTLTTPVIHSLSKTYGERDLGLPGIEEVIKNHVCSKECLHLQSMREAFEEAKKYQTRSTSFGNC